MKPFDRPVSSYMTANVTAVDRDTPLVEVVKLLAGPAISAVPVCAADRSVVGVISRTDLIREGLLNTGARGASAAIALPAKTAELLMSPRPVVVSSTTHLRDAAALMLAQHVHRVFVVDQGVLTGVLSANDLARAVRDARVETPLSEIMSTPLVSIEARTPLSAAIDQLTEHKVSGLVVTDDGWPVGMFTQTEVLASRDLPRNTRVDDVLDPSMVCLPLDMPVHRAAATAFELGARRVIACQHREAVGIVSGMDFVKLAATA